MLYTIGHSNHSLETFQGLLETYSIELIVDVRSNPYSAYCPHFNQGRIEKLNKVGISYLYLGDQLGGKPKDPKYYPNGYVDYSLLAQGTAFKMGLEQVLELKEQAALMCSEHDPIECHRALVVCRALRGQEIQHIHRDGRLESHKGLEKRLLVRYGKARRIEKAYDLQGAKIAPPLSNTKP
jgi:uncharacterized protein (DUF488 family)